MATMHISMGEKGGIGKSQSCIFLAQGLMNAGRKVALIDLDPATSALVKYKGLDVIVIDNMINPDTKDIDPSRFDELIEIANSRTELDDIIIDSGASNCIQFFNYIARNDAIELFELEGHRAIIHTVLQGGDNQETTLKTLTKIFELFPDAKKILWANEYIHKMKFPGKKANEFLGADAIMQQPAAKAGLGSVLAIFKLPFLIPNTEAPQINKMNELGILFSEVRGSDIFKIAEKHRLDKFSKIVLGQISDGMTKILTKKDAA
ncbi:MAG: AAA family ATPase [Gammaproteobacteria bacterium]|nr:AAA family ATPase [Gammaproteobacteria bacterium]